MFTNITGYRIEEKLHTTSLASVYRALRLEDGQAVIIKTLNDAYPRNRHVTKILREYQIAQKLHAIEGVIQVYALETFGHGNLAIVMQPFGQSLRQETTPISLSRFFNIAQQLTKTLGRIHQENVIHKDINPKNILLDSATDAIRVIDFGISSELSRERQDVNVSKRLEGSLPYISPEQTGRMNRDLDYRSDYYSLGVTFYTLVTGKLPFQAQDILGWVHCHISQHPPAPARINPNVPAALSAIILKLMAKNPEERYQSAFGLSYDLTLCEEQFGTSGALETFTLGAQDVSEKFQIPQTLYGRTQEIAALMQTFDAVANGHTEMILVAGYAGVGKSALVQEIHKPIVREKGCFIEGKFDQFQRDIPYSAIVQAFRSMIRQLLSEPANRMASCKRALQEAIGSNLQILVELIPDLEKIVGPQPLVTDLPPTEAQNRFQLVFQIFVNVFIHRGCPLVIFLDDLQWSDAPTLKLLQKLITSTKLRHLLIIGAYRSNEVDAAHPLQMMLDELEQNKPIQHLWLKPLDEKSVNTIVADTLHCTEQQAQGLSELLSEKTQGNPFFVNELLKNLHQQGAIQFHTDSGKWHWKMDDARAAQISDNVVTFMLSRLRMLSLPTQQALQMAACIGATFDLKTLSIITENTLEATNNTLQEALDQGLVIPLDEIYKFVVQTPGREPPEQSSPNINPHYKFQHDRVQQAAYALIDADKRHQAHLSIGRLMQRHTKPAQMDERIVDIVRHMNAGAALICDEQESENLARLNLRVGTKAKAATAYQPALQHFACGIALLPEQAWQDEYPLMLELSLGYTQCAYLTGNFDAAEEHIEQLLAQVKTNMEKAQILVMRARQYATMGKMQESIQIGMQGFKLLGINISEHAGQLSVLKELFLARWRLGGKNIAQLIHAPKLTDQKQRMVLQLIMEIGAPAYMTGRHLLFVVLCLKAANIALRYGNSPEGAFALGAYGMLLGSLRAFKSGYAFGKLSIKLTEQFQDTELSSRVFYVYALLIHPWNHHWSTMTPWFKKGIEAGYRSGDLLYLASNALFCVCWNPKLDIKTAYREQKQYLSIIKECNYQDTLDMMQLSLQTALNYQHMTHDQLTMNDADFDEQRCLQGMRERKCTSGIAIYHTLKAEIAFFYEDYAEAITHITAAGKIIQSLIATPYEVRFRLIAFLSYASHYPTMNAYHKFRAKQRLRKEYRRMKAWATHCAVNFQHLQFLMEAELARLTQQFQVAAKRYDQAIKTASAHGFDRDEALANELAAKFCLSIEQEKAAMGYMREAQYLYYRWGAKRKTEQMQTSYPSLLLTKKPGMIPDVHKETYFADDDEHSLDLSSVMKSVNIISQEIQLEHLLDKMIRILTENAGAQKGFLLLRQDDAWKIQAQHCVEQQTVTVLQSADIKQAGRYVLCPAILNYVEKTQKPLVLDHAAQHGDFTQDVYVLEQQPKSVLCTPIIHQGKITGILYLENNLNTGVFTSARMQLLQLLSSQTAISLENAQLYANLEKYNEQLEEKLKIQAERDLIKETFGYYVPNAISDNVINGRINVGGENRVVSVLFSDIRGFTTFSERMTAQKLFYFLKAYFDEMTEPIVDMRGTLIQCVGDEMIALFGAPVESENHALDACRSALAMQQRLSEMRQLTDDEPIFTGVGINTGEMLVGILGSSQRFHYGALGDNVNIGSRLESATKQYGVDIIISEQTHQSAQTFIHARELDFVVFKGRKEPTRIYQLLGLVDEPLNAQMLELLKQFKAGLKSYQAGDFVQASSHFKLCLKINIDDKPSQLFLRRSHQLQHSPPLGLWIGISELQSK